MMRSVSAYYQDMSKFNRIPPTTTPTSLELTALRLMRDPNLPVPLRAVNQLSSGARRRVYRTLISPALLTRFGIHPVTWKGANGHELVQLMAKPGSAVVKLSARHHPDAPDPFAYIELMDNPFNGIDVLLLVLSDPHSPRFQTDYTVEGGRTLFGTAVRNLTAEEQAMNAGLAPAQIRQGLRASGMALQQMESFLAMMGHNVVYVEPLTYADAWLFERRGFRYVTGSEQMRVIDQEFGENGRLYTALDNSTPFRQRQQATTVRGRAWAIHDGILETIGTRWDNIRMIKHIGIKAGINTFPDAVY